MAAARRHRVITGSRHGNGAGGHGDLSRFGQVVAAEPGQATLQVAAEEVSGAVARILGALPACSEPQQTIAAKPSAAAGGHPAPGAPQIS